VWAIVVNLARSVLRQRTGRVDSESETFAVSNGQSGEWRELRAAVAALPERQRLAVFLRHYADMDYQQVATVLEIERGTVAATLHAAHTALRKQLNEVPR
jgi:RNA polymerase sigma factor (sigma-70 family)